ncbi:unnamed protein product [Parajaminaea phylloscopi]
MPADRRFFTEGIRINISSASAPDAGIHFPETLHGDRVFYLDTRLPSEGDSRWQSLLLERRLEVEPAWREDRRILGPEVLSRWPAWSIFELMAVAVGSPAHWSVRIGDVDNDEHEFTSEQVRMARGPRLGSTPQPEHDVEHDGERRYSGLDLIRQWGPTVVVWLVLKALPSPSLSAETHSITAEEAVALAPAYFSHAVINREFATTTSPIDDYSPPACTISGLTSATEYDHLCGPAVSAPYLARICDRVSNLTAGQPEYEWIHPSNFAQRDSSCQWTLDSTSAGAATTRTDTTSTEAGIFGWITRFNGQVSGSLSSHSSMLPAIMARSAENVHACFADFRMNDVIDRTFEQTIS